MTAYELANRFLQPFKTRGDEIVPKLCPFCQGGEHRDKETFAVNMSNGVYRCARGSCGAKGHLSSLKKHLGVENEYTPITKTYRKPAVSPKKRTTQAEEYLATRGISVKTMNAYSIRCDGNGNIMFPFMRDKELVFVKYRPAREVNKGEQKSWREKDAEPILLGMDGVDYDQPLCICEGEIDCLSLHEANIPNAVSVPSGSQEMTWIENCWDFLDNFSKIILCGDNDAPGREMVNALIKRLGSWRCATVTLPDDCKDANDVLCRHGRETLRNAVLSASDVPVIGLVRLADVRPENAVSVESVGSGISHLDSDTGGFLMGELSVWTGKRGSGKSTLAGQALLEAVDQGYRVCAYSGELRAARFQNWIDMQAAGPDNIQMVFSARRGHEVPIVPQETRDKIHEWYSEMFFLYDNTVVGTPEEQGILETFELAVRKYGCRVFLVDNLMTGMDRDIQSEKDYYHSQGMFVGKLVTFAKKYNVHVHLIAHPRKFGKENRNASIDDGDDVAGSSQITDRADNVFSVRRIQEGPTELKILKNREDGVQFGVPIGLDFCKLSRRLYALTDKGKKYGWEFPKWSNELTQNNAPWDLEV